MCCLSSFFLPEVLFDDCCVPLEDRCSCALLSRADSLQHKYEPMLRNNIDFKMDSKIKSEAALALRGQRISQAIQRLTAYADNSEGMCTTLLRLNCGHRWRVAPPACGCGQNNNNEIRPGASNKFAEAWLKWTRSHFFNGFGTA